MTSEFVKNKIQTECQEFDIIVLKGFSPSIIQELGKDFLLLDDYIIENGRIILEKVNANHLMLSFISHNSTTKAICTCESFIKLCTSVNGLDILNKQICVLENNLFELYPNPTNCEVPDFDSADFENTDSETMLYSAFYSYCINEDGMQRIQYINNYTESNTCVKVKGLITTQPFTTEEHKNYSQDLKVLSTKDGSLSKVMECLYNSMNIEEREYAIEAEDMNEERLGTFVEAARIFGCSVTLYNLSRSINVKPREELYTILEEVWGYNSFRNLKLYKDPRINRDTIEVSQGAVIETVVLQAENAYYGRKEKVENILLTSPTGAGKSLLFQLSAIYLAEKYKLLTIIISPLVALMKDQVEGLQGYDAVATINSNITAARKEAVLSGIKEGKIHLLYLSPELLLSYTITSFIGSRKLGLLVVDEAHTVTTWGRDFRVDYWFLGDYLRKARRILNYPFPIFALTATAVWNPSGKNDMVSDTIRSLNMDPCIKFLGVAKRTNIVFEIEQSNISKNYEEKRKQLTIQRIREALDAGRKTIVYFPFRSTVDSVFLSDDILDIKERVTRYHSQIFPNEKTINAEAFRSGRSPIMCATKAFGMGVDVSDIQEVYHHAPTGCLSDYIQEIGRLARDPKIEGIAKIDFSVNDFRYIRRLHGLSAIRPYQLTQVLKKLMSIYRINGEKRNMLISSDDFNYIFPLAKKPEDIDQNLKSCLLLISNDLLNKLGFHSLIVRPKSLFSKCYVQVPTLESKDFYRLNRRYLRHIPDTAVFILDADKYWMEKYNQNSFPLFKQKLATGKIFQGFNVELKNKVTLSFHSTTEAVLSDIERFFKEAHYFLNKMSSTHSRISVAEMKSSLPPDYDALRKEQFVETFRMLYASNCGLGGDVALYCKVYTTHDGTESFQLIQSGYENVYQLYRVAFDSKIHTNELCEYCSAEDSIIKLCEFLNSLGLADYYRQGGDQPAIFVRINNPYYLNSLIRDKTYKNSILENIYEKYLFSEKIFTYFFTTPMTNKQRWDFIESYFLGASEEELLNFVQA